MKYLNLLLLPIISGCSMNIPEMKSHTISYNHDYPWLEEPLHLAMDFWADEDYRGEFYIEMADNEGQIYIDVADQLADQFTIGQCDCGKNSGTIMILKSRSDNGDHGNSCLIAHELGHSIGMQHTKKDHNLMYPLLQDVDGGICWWGVEDQVEYDRIKYEQNH